MADDDGREPEEEPVEDPESPSGAPSSDSGDDTDVLDEAEFRSPVHARAWAKRQAREARMRGRGKPPPKAPPVHVTQTGVSRDLPDSPVDPGGGAMLGSGTAEVLQGRVSEPRAPEGLGGDQETKVWQDVVLGLLERIVTAVEKLVEQGAAPPPVAPPSGPFTGHPSGTDGHPEQTAIPGLGPEWGPGGMGEELAEETLTQVNLTNEKTMDVLEDIVSDFDNFRQRLDEISGNLARMRYS